MLCYIFVYIYLPYNSACFYKVVYIEEGTLLMLLLAVYKVKVPVTSSKACVCLCVFITRELKKGNASKLG